MNKTVVIGSVVVAAVLGGGFGLWMSQISGDRYAQCRSSAVAGGFGAIGGPFELVSETGETVTEAEVLTRPTLVYFGYTFCPDICPVDNIRNAEAIDFLQDDGYDIQPVMITVDPARDTPEVLAEFTGYMHPDMLGLTGTEAQIRAAAQAYKVYYRKMDDDPEYYLMDHSGFTYLMMPDDGFVELFRRDIPSEQMARQVACFLDAA